MLFWGSMEKARAMHAYFGVLDAQPPAGTAYTWGRRAQFAAACAHTQHTHTHRQTDRQTDYYLLAYPIAEKYSDIC